MVIVDGECVHVLYGTGCFSTKIIIREFLCQCQTWLPLPHHLPVKIMLSQKIETLLRETKQDNIYVTLSWDLG